MKKSSTGQSLEERFNEWLAPIAEEHKALEYDNWIRRFERSRSSFLPTHPKEHEPYPAK